MAHLLLFFSFSIQLKTCQNANSFCYAKLRHLCKMLSRRGLHSHAAPRLRSQTSSLPLLPLSRLWFILFSSLPDQLLEFRFANDLHAQLLGFVELAAGIFASEHVIGFFRAA